MRYILRLQAANINTTLTSASYASTLSRLFETLDEFIAGH